MPGRGHKVDPILRHIIHRVEQCAHFKIASIAGTDIHMPDVQGTAKNRTDFTTEFIAQFRLQLSRQMGAFKIQSVPQPAFGTGIDAVSTKNAGIMIDRQQVLVQRDGSCRTNIDTFPAVPAFLVLHFDPAPETGRYRRHEVVFGRGPLFHDFLQHLQHRYPLTGPNMRNIVQSSC